MGHSDGVGGGMSVGPRQLCWYHPREICSAQHLHVDALVG